ncbi:Hpt domain-containing protein [Pseudoalteromonas spongiae]|uniref:Hpt domain-containing protein n=1 Tax=Pseudoalteromonas spongiae TaxID=298657 RepID=UPI0037355322
MPNSDHMPITYNNKVMLELIGEDYEKIQQFQSEFLHQANVYFRKLVETYNQEQFDIVKQHAHFLKTSAKAIGAERTAYFLATIEKYASNKDKPALKQLLLKLKIELTVLAEELNS